MMKKKALIACRQNPYPVVRGGIERLIVDFESHILSDYDVYFLYYHEALKPRLFHNGKPASGTPKPETILRHDFQFALYFNYEFDLLEHKFIKPLLDRIPSFCFMQSHPLEGVRDSAFRGIFAHSVASPNRDVLILGGAYNSDIFCKNRRREEFLVCVGRINADKNQLELVRDYKKRIYDRFSLPLYLLGGAYTPKFVDYALDVGRYIDNVSVLSTMDLHDPLAGTNWKTPAQVAEACNRARMFVNASLEESFCIALTEALACGTTCVVNGKYYGFDGDDLGPNIYGNIDGKEGSILDVVEEALLRDIRIDASEWVKKYSLTEAKKKVLSFIAERL
jgi:glycosyltransferase involved in cell wall biosynthesis